MKYALYLILSLLLACTGTKKENTPIVKAQAGKTDFDAKLKELGITLDKPSAPVANYVNARRVGNMLYLAGKGPLKPVGSENEPDENFPLKGKLGDDMTIEQGYEAGRLTAIAHLSVLEAELGDLNKVKQFVQVTGMVNCTPDFPDQPKVVNGYSDLMVKVFGEKGKHARAAVGMASLPSNIPIEVVLVVEVED